MEVSYYKDSESAENTLYGVNFFDHYTEFNNIPGNDIFAKPEFCTEDNQLQDITNSLVFYNGRIGLADSKNAPVRYWVTDDLIGHYKSFFSTGYIKSYLQNISLVETFL